MTTETTILTVPPSSSAVIGTTHTGIQITEPHWAADRGYRYRITEVSGFRHVSEYVASFGTWVYCGYLKTAKAGAK